MLPNQFFWGGILESEMFSTPSLRSQSKSSSWPTRVTSRNDAFEFAKLICGPDAKIDDYDFRLPHATDESFLLVVRGGCKTGPLSHIGKCIEQLLDEVKTYESEKNSQNPEKAIAVRGSKGAKTVYYYSAQLSCNPCTCRSIFGADSNQQHIPTSSSFWEAGKKFHSIVDSVVQKNHQDSGNTNAQQQPVWLRKTWSAVMNYNDHKENHSIDYHADLSAWYDAGDPITSFSFGQGGVLLLKSKVYKNNVQTMIFQEHGDVLIMAGGFQDEFEHCVPARGRWGEALQFCKYRPLSEMELQGVQDGIAMHSRKDGDGPHIRLNCTLRWNHNHSSHCPCNLPRQQGVQNNRTPYPFPHPGSAVHPSPTPKQQFFGVKRALESTEKTDEENDALVWKSFAEELLDNCMLQSSLESELELLKSWSIGGSHVLKSPVDALKAVAKATGQKELMMSRISDQMKKLERKGYQKDFSVYHLVRVACKHLATVYECGEKLKIHDGRNNYFLHCVGSNTQHRLHNFRGDLNWKKYMVNHNQLWHIVGALDADKTVQTGQLAVMMSCVLKGILPQKIKAAKQGREKKSTELVLEEVHCWDSSGLLLIKAFEIGYVPSQSSSPPPPTRLQTRDDIFNDVFTAENKCDAIQAVRGLVEGYLSFLQCVDHQKEFHNNHTEFAPERYNIFFWATPVPEEWRPRRST